MTTKSTFFFAAISCTLKKQDIVIIFFRTFFRREALAVYWVTNSIYFKIPCLENAFLSTKCQILARPSGGMLKTDWSAFKPCMCLS